MVPKVLDFSLLIPSQTADFTDSGGLNLKLPIFVSKSTGKEYVQCNNCDNFFLLNASRTPTYLANHRKTDTCKKAGERLRRKQLSTLVIAEASSVHNRVFDHGNAGLRESLALTSFIRDNSESSTSSTPTPFSSVPTTPTMSNLRPTFLDIGSSPDHNTATSNSNLVNLTVGLQLDLSNLPKSSPPSSPGNIDVDNDDDDDELPELDELSDSEDDNEIDEQLRYNSTNIKDICHGQRVQWMPGSVWDTFPYQQHADNTIGWKPCLLDGANDDWIRLRSTRCKGSLTTYREKELQACASCLKIVNTNSFRNCVKRAEGNAAAHTPWKYLTPKQMHRLLFETKKRNNLLKLNVLSLSRKVGHLQNKVNDFQRVVILLSQNKVAGVSRVLNTALRNGASARAIYDRLQDAITHAYSTRGKWTVREFDVAFLVKALGGPRLLYVLQKEEGYPSLTTLRRQKPIPEITISTGMPAKAEFTANIAAFLGSSGRKPPTNQHVGQVLMMDGVALEETCRFDLKRNCILGLCREHSANIKLTVDDICDVERVSNSLFKDHTVHHGKDGTVVGLAPITDRENYFTVPLILSASCKTEKGQDMAQWIPSFLDLYRNHPDGEKRHGPIYTVATDGESSFRNLRFQIGLTQSLPLNSAVGRLIYQLHGINRRTGAYGLLTTCDPKHIIKRFATMIRSPSGIQISETHLSTETFRDALLELDNMQPEKVHQLLHPADKQNVPKAVNLLQCLYDLKEKEQTVNPSIQNRMRLIVFLAKALGYFLFPFIDVQMSLSYQIRSLSSYAHIMTAMYRRHRTSFLTSALYADSQAIVKNIFFTIARLQVADPSLEYFILFEGTDRLEGVFSNVRTQDHARNFDILQLAQKLSIGAEVNAIFLRNPDLDRGHIRRNLVNVRGVDHINPASWQGDTVVGHVDIAGEYFRGREDANRLLAEYLGENAQVDFDSLFLSAGADKEPTIDHLRPFGQYVGSKVVNSEGNIPVLLSDDFDEDEDDSEILEFDNNSLISNKSEALDMRDAVDISDLDSSMMDVEPEDRINPMIDKESHRIKVNGRSEYKPTLIARMLTSESGKKVTTRPLRARGIAVSDALQSRLESLNNSLQGEITDDRIKSGDLGAFLVRIGNIVCFAASEIMSFQKDHSKIPLSSINFDDLEATGRDTVTVTVQILELKPIGTEPNLNWVWPSSRRFLRVQGKKDGPQLQRDFVLQIPGKDFHPIGPSIVDDHGIPTWSIRDTDLKDVFEHAWSLTRVESDQTQTTSNVQHLPEIVEGCGLPYMLLNSVPRFSLSLKNIVELPTGRKKNEDDAVACRICDKIISLKDMRNHVGRHILLSIRNCEDKLAKNEVGVDPCGWCGLDGQCRTHLHETTTPSITSNCEYHYERMSYKKAIVPSKRTPSTNVPLNCPLCMPNSESCTFWKYNLLFHMTTHHLRDNGEFPPFPHQLLVQSHITKAEELALGVGTKHTSDWRYQFDWPPSDAIEKMDTDELYELCRKRANSSLSEASASSRQPSPTKKSHLVS